MPHLNEHSPAPNSDGEPEGQEHAWDDEGRVIALELDVQQGIYRAEPSNGFSSPVHREVLARVLANPGHSLYDALAEGDLARVWLGPSQAPVQVIFSAQRLRCEDGAERAAFAVAFADVADGDPTHRRAVARMRLLEGASPVGWANPRRFGAEPQVTLGG